LYPKKDPQSACAKGTEDCGVKRGILQKCRTTNKGGENEKKKKLTSLGPRESRCPGEKTKCWEITRSETHGEVGFKRLIFTYNYKSEDKGKERQRRKSIGHVLLYRGLLLKVERDEKKIRGKKGLGMQDFGGKGRGQGTIPGT